MIRPLTNKDKTSFIDFCTKNNIENSEVLYNKIMKHGAKCTIQESKDIIGMLVVEKVENKHFLSVYTTSTKVVSNLVKQYIWGCKTGLYIKLIPNSPFIKTLTRLGFRIYSKRGNETVDMIREFNKKFYFKKRVIRNG